MAKQATTDEIAAPLRPAAGEDADTAAPRVYPPSIVDRLLARVDALPGLPATAYLVALIVLMLAVNAVTWVHGEPVGSFDAYRTSLPFYLIFPLAMMHHLNRVARRALATFRPALEVDGERDARFAYELTTLPDRGTWAVLAASLPFTALFSAYTPSFTDAISDAPLVAAFDIVFYALTFGIIAVFIYHTFRQLSTVSRIHRAAENVNLFQPAPLYAFSWLTARTAGVLLVLNAYSILTDPATFVNPALFGLVVFAWFAAGASFILPLRGMRERIAEEKRRLLGEINERLDATVQRLYRDADQEPIEGMDQLNQLLTGLITTRRLVSDIPTWPWDGGALTRFLSAAVLPILAALISALGGSFA